jgi:predicted membrane protein
MRIFSLFLAGAVCLALFTYPYVIGNQLSPIDRVALMVVLVACGGAIAFGLGFRFERPLPKMLSSPPIIWPVIIGGFLIMLSY